jgi:hypothetical protein
MMDSTSVLVGMTPYEQTIFEQRVASRFCERNVCENLPGITGRMATAGIAPSSTARWSFSDQPGPSYNTEGELEIQFTSIADLRWKRTACAAVSGDVLFLAERIALERANGTLLDWNAIAIHPRAGGDIDRVVLNERGEYLLLRLPALSAVPEFFRLVLPWLIARMGGVNYGLVVVNGKRVLAPLSQPIHRGICDSLDRHTRFGTQRVEHLRKLRKGRDSRLEAVEVDESWES